MTDMKEATRPEPEHDEGSSGRHIVDYCCELTRNCHQKVPVPHQRDSNRERP